MNVQIKSSHGIAVMPIDTRLLAQRIIFVEGDINHEMADLFLKQTLLLCKEDANKPIDVIINSPGGEISAGLLMYDCIQSSKAPMRMYCAGKAYSMAAILFASGNNGRFMFPHSELLLHEPRLGGEIGGNVSSIQSVSESLMNIRNKVNGILAEHTGKTVKQIEKATAYDHFFSPEESISFGLADEIIDLGKLIGGMI
ncbi:MAG: ATP-dependent Clp protease proteolytic subunit [Ruminococcus sp.]|nr:ATP-dependent Clp protease proteolytic subunit [Ruminococcus sp.]